ncbi:MAG TPA: hypothetical protein PKM65_20455 [Spirochaetota bacterium]|nr:hypothetical protein [Spirochaetota bacterium]
MFDLLYLNFTLPTATKEPLLVPRKPGWKWLDDLVSALEKSKVRESRVDRVRQIGPEFRIAAKYRKISVTLPVNDLRFPREWAAQLIHDILLMDKKLHFERCPSIIVAVLIHYMETV